MAEEIKVLGGNHVVAVGVDADGKMYALPLASGGGTLETGASSDETAASVDVNESGTADVEPAVAAQAGLRLMGYSIRESAATAAVAAVRIINGATVAGGTPVARINLNPDESTREWFGPHGINCADGISIDRESGSTEVDIWYKVF